MQFGVVLVLYSFAFNLSPVPSSPPNHLYFSREVSDIQSHYSSKVTVTWQPLASDLHGGEGLHYKLHVYNGEVLERTLFTNNTFAVLDKLPSAKMEARVWAVNILGQSYDYTSIALPLHIDYKGVDLQVEFFERRNKVLVFANYAGISADSIALHWCQRSGSSHVCLEAPNTHKYCLRLHYLKMKCWSTT